MIKLLNTPIFLFFPPSFLIRNQQLPLTGSVEWWPVCGWSGVGGMHGIHPGWEIGCFKQISD